MDSSWAPVVAALGASALTTVGLLLRDSWLGKKASRTASFEAYRDVLTASMMVVNLATGMRMTMRIRSGVRESLDIVLHHRKPLEPLELSDRMAGVLKHLVAAQTAVWTTGSQRGIELTNKILEGCMDLLSVATTRGEAGSSISRYVAGERWTREQEAAFTEASQAVGAARKDGGLTPAQPAVILLRYYLDWSAIETAKAVGKNPATVRVLTHQGIERLRCILVE